MIIVYLHSHDTGPGSCSGKRIARLRHARQAGLLLTGMSPHSCGMLGLVHRGFSLANPERHLASFLRENGFRTVLCGVPHEGKDPAGLGYTDYLSVESHHNDERNAVLAVRIWQDT